MRTGDGPLCARTEAPTAAPTPPRPTSRAFYCSWTHCSEGARSGDDVSLSFCHRSEADCVAPAPAGCGGQWCAPTATPTPAPTPAPPTPAPTPAGPACDWARGELWDGAQCRTRPELACDACGAPGSNNRLCDCGHPGISRKACEAKGCCFDAGKPKGAANWCFPKVGDRAKILQLAGPGGVCTREGGGSGAASYGQPYLTGGGRKPRLSPKEEEGKTTTKSFVALGVACACAGVVVAALGLAVARGGDGGGGGGEATAARV